MTDTFIGLQLPQLHPDDVKLHVTLTFIEGASEMQREEAWQVYTKLLAHQLPLMLQLGEQIKVGRDKDLLARRVIVNSPLRAQLEAAYEKTSVRANDEFPTLLLHVTINSEEKQKTLERAGENTMANKLYMATTGDDKRVLRTLTGSVE